MAEPHELLGLDLDDPETAAAVEDSNAFADLIDCLVGARKKLGLTQQQIAERMGTTQSAVSDFERIGGDPRNSTIQRYARAVGGRLHQLFASDPTHVRVQWATATQVPPDAPAAAPVLLTPASPITSPGFSWVGTSRAVVGSGEPLKVWSAG